MSYPTRPSAAVASKAELPRLCYKLDESAHILGVSPVTIRRAIKDGRLKANRKLRHVLIPASELIKFAAVE
jgi:excisionase family DNA binding protein